MFSGIIEELTTVVSIDQKGIVIKSELDHSDTNLGDSIALNGCCLTVVKINGKELSFEISPETFRRTTFSDIKVNDRINLERSLIVGERINGHFVFGHVDGVTTLLEQKEEGNSSKFVWSIPNGLKRYIAEKGSISISGVSLTVGEVWDDRFAVYIVPHTAEVTNITKLKKANLEIDMLARYVLGGGATYPLIK